MARSSTRRISDRGQLTAISARSVDVARRIDVVLGRSSAAAPRTASRVGRSPTSARDTSPAARAVAQAQKADARTRCMTPSASSVTCGRDPGQREVAVAPRDLVEREAGSVRAA